MFSSSLIASGGGAEHHCVVRQGALQLLDGCFLSTAAVSQHEARARILLGVSNFPHFNFSSLTCSDYETEDADFVWLLQQTKSCSQETQTVAAADRMATAPHGTRSAPPEPRQPPVTGLGPFNPLCFSNWSCPSRSARGAEQPATPHQRPELVKPTPPGTATKTTELAQGRALKKRTKTPSSCYELTPARKRLAYPLPCSPSFPRRPVS